MDLLLDTHTIAWLVLDDRRLSRAFVERLSDKATRLFVSTVTAWEFVELSLRGRLPPVADYAALAEQLDVEELDFPAGLWAIASALPEIHRDPVDRMLIAHAIHADLTLVTADEDIRRYPVRSLW